MRIKDSLENFVCKYNSEAILNSQFSYFEHNIISTNNLFEQHNHEASPKDYDEDLFVEDTDENDIQEPDKVRDENDKVLLQIPLELLPCSQEVKTVTDRTYTHPSQNEVKDYRNFILSKSSDNRFSVKVLIVFVQSVFGVKYIL